MRPVQPPSIIEQGIVVYVPTVANYLRARIEIFYSAINPNFVTAFCQEGLYKIWEKTDDNFDKGIMFAYNSPTILRKGYYKITLSLVNRNGLVGRGSKIIGLLKEKNTLYIGVPYSTFGPIDIG